MQGREKYNLDKKRITLAKGIDAFDNAGSRQRKTLALPLAFRAEFFAQRPALLDFLRRVPDNPPIEEGFYVSQDNRQHEGEHFLTTDGSRILINDLVREKYTHLNTDNIALIDDDTKELEEYIKQWSQSNSVDAKIAYVNYRHHITMYLRNIDGKTHCFILDTQPKRRIDNVTSAIHAAIPDAEITLSTTPLQLDFFSCPIFAMKALRFYIKHGPELFKHIQEQERVWNEQLQAYQLKPNGLMPQLYKMMQSRMQLPNDVLDSVVSKNNETLREHLTQYSITLDNNSYNAKSFIKRYQYLDYLYSKLTGNKPSDDRSLHELVRDSDFKAILEYIDRTDINSLHQDLRRRDSSDNTPFDLLTEKALQSNPEQVNKICSSIRGRYNGHNLLFRDLMGKVRNMSFTTLLNRPKPKAAPGFFSKTSKKGGFLFSRKSEKHIRNRFNRF